jgi:bacterial/archaeal transporter family protein
MADTDKTSGRGLASIAPAWLWLSLLTILLWGAWGLQSKIIAEKISPWMNQVLFPIGLLPPFAWMFLSKNLRKGAHLPKGSIYAFITGILGGTGNIAFLAAMSTGGKAAIVVPWVGLAPLVTVILARFTLQESITRVQMAGLALALVAIYLLSI